MHALLAPYVLSVILFAITTDTLRHLETEPTKRRHYLNLTIAAPIWPIAVVFVINDSLPRLHKGVHQW